MTPLFADTFFFLALLNRADHGHERAVAYVQGLSSDLMTTVWILTELADALSDPTRRHEFIDLLGFLRSHPRVTIVPADQTLFETGVSLYASRTDKEWSLTDCISFTVMTQYGIPDALTGDRHFEQAGFRALLR